MTLLPECDYFVYFAPLPLSVRGVVTPNDDSTFSVYINSRLSDEAQREAYLHELKHILRGDFYSGESIQKIENM